MTPTTEWGVIVLSVVAMIGGFLMALIKMFERNGAMIKCGSCGCTCECDMRRHETRLEEARALAARRSSVVEKEMNTV